MGTQEVMEISIEQDCGLHGLSLQRNSIDLNGSYCSSLDMEVVLGLDLQCR